MVEFFVDSLAGLATQSTAQTKLKLLEIEITVKRRLNQFFSALSERRCRKETILELEDGCTQGEEQEVSTQFSQTQKFKILIWGITWKDIAMFFQSLTSTAQNMTIIQ